MGEIETRLTETSVADCIVACEVGGKNGWEESSRDQLSRGKVRNSVKARPERSSWDWPSTRLRSLSLRLCGLVQDDPYSEHIAEAGRPRRVRRFRSLQAQVKV
jgi:hypothetical protein